MQELTHRQTLEFDKFTISNELQVIEIKMKHLQERVLNPDEMRNNLFIGMMERLQKREADLKDLYIKKDLELKSIQ